MWTKRNSRLSSLSTLVEPNSPDQYYKRRAKHNVMKEENKLRNRKKFIFLLEILEISLDRSVLAHALGLISLVSPWVITSFLRDLHHDKWWCEGLKGACWSKVGEVALAKRQRDS